LPNFPVRGQVVVVNLEPAVGTEIRKTRPCLVISNNVANEHSPQITVVPITPYDPRKATFPICIEVPTGEGGLKGKSIVNASQIRTIDKRRLTRTLAPLSKETMNKVDVALRVHLNLQA
jgi:mRNA interferase MazF